MRNAFYFICFLFFVFEITVENRGIKINWTHAELRTSTWKQLIRKWKLNESVRLKSEGHERFR